MSTGFPPPGERAAADSLEHAVPVNPTIPPPRPPSVAAIPLTHEAQAEQTAAVYESASAEPLAHTQMVPVVSDAHVADALDVPAADTPVPLKATESPATVAPAVRPFAYGAIAPYLFSRLLAFGVDVAVVGGVIAISAYSLVDQNPLSGLPLHNEEGFDLTLGVAALATLLYIWIFEALFRTTIGKLIFGLMVTRTGGGAPGFVRAFVRTLLRPLDVLLIGPLLAAVTPKHQRVGDLLAGTTVSRPPIGPLAPVIGILAVIGLFAFQWTFGGGFFALAAFGASAADFGPNLIGNAAAWIHNLFPRAV